MILTPFKKTLRDREAFRSTRADQRYTVAARMNGTGVPSMMLPGLDPDDDYVVYQGPGSSRGGDIVRCSDTPSMMIKKADSVLQIVWGEVYAPDFPDSQNDFMTAETIRTMAYNFMQKSDMMALDTGHNRERNGSYIVESFITRKGDPTFIEGSWVLGVHIPDPEIWSKVEKGEINGFSMDGEGFRVEKDLEVTMPDFLTGMTDVVNGEQHEFRVQFDKDGNFMGGETSPGVDGHTHKILRGTLTEESNGHAHRFSFVEGVMDVKVSN